MEEEETIKNTNLEASATYLPSQPPPYGSFHKIFRKGIEIHEMSSENITMIQPINLEEPIDRVEPIPSGESLFKTFAFDGGISQDETEKCLSFWRSVVERNLEPIKCTLMDNRTCGREKKGLTRKKRDKTNPLPPHKKTNVWLELLQELQEKKLHQVKLLMEKRCRFCDYLTSGYVKEDPRKETQEMIDELATWKPQSNKLKKSTLQNKSLSGGKSVQPEKNEEKGNTLNEVREESLNEQRLREIKRESEKFEYANVVEAKKQNGAYSKWRENRCTCERNQCDCNANIPRPSKQSVTNPEKSISLILHCACASSHCDCVGLVAVPEKTVINQAAPPIIAQSSTKVQKVDSLELVKKRQSRSSSLQDAEKAIKEHQDLVKKIKSADSLEIARKRLSSKCDEERNDSPDDAGSRKRYVSIMMD